MIHLLRRALVASVLFASATAGLAQSYPTRPITLIAASAPGGILDQLARAYGAALTRETGQTVIVENRGGAGGTLAASMLVKAPPDGYTMCFCYSGPVALVKASLDKVPYDIDKDFLPVTRAYNLTPIITVPATSTLKTFDDLLRVAKEQPGTLSYGHTGVGGALHLGFEDLSVRAGLRFIAIPYAGENPMVPDLISGRIDIGVMSPLFAKAQAEAGKVRILASMGLRPVLPGVPAVATYPGFAGFEAGSWTGFFLPAGTPDAVLRKAYELVQRASRSQDVHDRLTSFGVTPVVDETPEQFAKFVDAEKKRALETMKRLGGTLAK